MKQMRFVKVTVILPEDLLAECYRFIDEKKVCNLYCLIQLALMQYMHLGRCERTGLLCRGDSPPCEFYEPKKGDEKGGS
jgi:hypothetical protein